MRSIVLLLLIALSGCVREQETASRLQTEPRKRATIKWQATVATAEAGKDPDDPAIWVHPENPELSLILATNKADAPAGSIVVYDLRGKIVQTIAKIDHPNNIDVRQNVKLGSKTLDLAVATERYKRCVRIFTIDAKTRRLTEVAAPKVFQGEIGESGAPMGIAMYIRQSDGSPYIIVGRKSGPANGYLWQYKLQPDFSLVKIREFGRFSGESEIEAIVADDELGFVYYADETVGIRKYQADPSVVRADDELALFGKSGYKGDQEGLAIYRTGPETGYLISTDQIKGGSRYFVYDRKNQVDPIAVIEGGADETDGIEVTSVPLGPNYPLGLFVAMNSKGRNFLFYRWQEFPK